MKYRIIIRIICLPFAMAQLLILSFVLYFRWIFNYILHGAEFIVYTHKNEPKKIADIMNYLEAAIPKPKICIYSKYGKCKTDFNVKNKIKLKCSGDNRLCIDFNLEENK